MTSDRATLQGHPAQRRPDLCNQDGAALPTAALRALVEQEIAHPANAWALRRRRGLLDRVGDVYRAAK